MEPGLQPVCLTHCLSDSLSHTSSRTAFIPLTHCLSVCLLCLSLPVSLPSFLPSVCLTVGLSVYHAASLTENLSVFLLHIIYTLSHSCLTARLFMPHLSNIKAVSLSLSLSLQAVYTRCILGHFASCVQSVLKFCVFVSLPVCLFDVKMNPHRCTDAVYLSTCLPVCLSACES